MQPLTAVPAPPPPPLLLHASPPNVTTEQRQAEQQEHDNASGRQRKTAATEESAPALSLLAGASVGLGKDPEHLEGLRRITSQESVAKANQGPSLSSSSSSSSSKVSRGGEDAAAGEPGLNYASCLPPHALAHCTDDAIPVSTDEYNDLG